MWRRNCLAGAGALRLRKMSQNAVAARCCRRIGGRENRVIVGRREWEAAYQLWWLLLYVDLLWLAFFLVVVV